MHSRVTYSVTLGRALKSAIERCSGLSTSPPTFKLHPCSETTGSLKFFHTTQKFPTGVISGDAPDNPASGALKTAWYQRGSSTETSPPALNAATPIGISRNMRRRPGSARTDVTVAGSPPTRSTPPYAANSKHQTRGAVGPSLSPRKPSPDIGRSTKATIAQPAAANESACGGRAQTCLAQAQAPPRDPSPTIMPTIRPASSTTLPACCRVSIRNPKTKPGITARMGCCSSCGSGVVPMASLARYISATRRSPATTPDPKPRTTTRRVLMGLTTATRLARLSRYSEAGGRNRPHSAERPETFSFGVTLGLVARISIKEMTVVGDLIAVGVHRHGQCSGERHHAAGIPVGQQGGPSGETRPGAFGRGRGVDRQVVQREAIRRGQNFLLGIHHRGGTLLQIHPARRRRGRRGCGCS